MRIVTQVPTEISKILAIMFSKLASRDYGRFPLGLRMFSFVLCIGSIISGSFAPGSAVSGSTPLIFIPSCIILAWDLIYFTFSVKILPPVTITFDLIAWLLAVIWGVMFSITTVPALGRLLSAGQKTCSNPHDPCIEETRSLKAIVSTCVLLWALT